MSKVKSYGDEATDFHDKEMPKEDSNHTYLAVITIDFAFKKENYYPQVFLKERKYIEKGLIRHITEDIEVSLVPLMKNDNFL